jgi:hypothetical protein
MIAARPKDRVETYEEMRARLIAETSEYLTECLRHPELAVRIPTIQAGRGRFPPSLAVAFWGRLLGE